MPEYGEIDAISFSKLKHMHTSPKHYRWFSEHPMPSKPHFVIGNAIHTKVLEPKKFDERYAECTITRNPRHQKFKDWMDDHPGAEPLTPYEMRDVERSAAALMDDPHAGPILAACRKEEPCTWTGPLGYLCKGRFDAIGTDAIVDLKTIPSIAGEKFERDAAKLLYHGQLVWYHDGAVAAKKISGVNPPIIIALEKEPPHDVGVFCVEGEAFDAGRRLYRDLLARLHVCIETNSWPGSMPEPMPLLLPRWAPGMQSMEDDF